MQNPTVVSRPIFAQTRVFFKQGNFEIMLKMTPLMSNSQAQNTPAYSGNLFDMISACVFKVVFYHHISSK